MTAAGRGVSLAGLRKIYDAPPELSAIRQAYRG